MSGTKRQMKITGFFSKASEANLKASMGVPAKRRKIDVPLQEIQIEESTSSSTIGIVSQSDNSSADRMISHSAQPSFSRESLLSSLTDPGWRRRLEPVLQSKYMDGITQFLEKEYKKGVIIFPPRELIFNAFNKTPFDQLRIVLLGQDPYHNENQAHGLCFSVPKGIAPPPSLKNIFKELATEIEKFEVPGHGCLLEWATQGVFMLNATLTVEAHKANSHSKIGWQEFTDAVIKLISRDAKNGVVFMLWGGFAHKKEELIDTKRHSIIKAAHPSPLSFQKFKGSKCFSRANEALIKLGRDPIDWSRL